MTPDQIVAEYLEREAKAKATPQGQDPAAIIEEIAAEIGMETAEVTEIVLNHTIYGAC